MPNPFNQQVIDEFRANNGVVSGPFDGSRLVLLTTTGTRTGQPHTTPLAYLPDDEERILVIGSAGGADRHPQWYRNLLAEPRVTVDSGLFRYEADAIVLDGQERDSVFDRAVEANSGWGEYQRNTSRVLPVVALRQIPAGQPDMPGARTMGHALVLLHDLFRRELRLIRAEVTASGRSLGAQLRVNCLTLCAGLHNHHTGEDTMMFPALAAEYPELEPTLDRLRTEHQRIDELVTELKAALSDAAPDRLGAEVDRLVDELEAHLDYEEEQLVPLLDRT